MRLCFVVLLLTGFMSYSSIGLSASSNQVETVILCSERLIVSEEEDWELKCDIRAEGAICCTVNDDGEIGDCNVVLPPSQD